MVAVIHQNFPQANTIFCEMSVTGQIEAGGMDLALIQTWLLL